MVSSNRSGSLGYTMASEIQNHIDAAPDGHDSGTVLVVEDEDLVRELACGILERSGYEVLEAGTFDEAIRLGRSHPGDVDVILCDVVMPRRSGPQICEAIAESRPGVKVLYMSGYPVELIDRRGLLPDGAPFIQKPFTPDELGDRIRDLLDA